MHRLGILSINRDPLSPVGSPTAGGQVTYINQLSGRLAEKGWEIDIFTAQFARDEAVSVMTDGVTVHRVPLPPGCQGLNTMEADDAWMLADACAKRASDLNRCHDVLFACYWQSIPAAVEMKARFGGVLALTYCSLGILKTLAYGVRESECRLDIERTAAKTFDAIVAMSVEEKRLIVKHYDASVDKIYVIPAGVDFDKFFPRHN